MCKLYLQISHCGSIQSEGKHTLLLGAGNSASPDLKEWKKVKEFNTPKSKIRVDSFLLEFYKALR